MNLQQHLLPASVAAVCHVALLLSGSPHLSDPAVSLSPMPTKEPLPVVSELFVVDPPDNDTDDRDQDAHPMKGDPPSPFLDEILRPDNPLAIPVELHQHKIQRPLEAKIDKIGLPGDPNGKDNGRPDLGNGRMLMSDMLEKIPRAKSQIPPGYPAAMRKDRIEGEVLVEFDVNTNGQVIAARVVRSTDRTFEEPTLQAVLKWRFEPGMKDGVPVPFWMAVPVSFTLRGS
jgi:periplasmic protein TonB